MNRFSSSPTSRRRPDAPGGTGRRRLEAVRRTSGRLGSREKALAFLHSPHGALGGQRPIDIAASSDLGLRAVISLLSTD